jgi:hypothetical protein
MAHALGPKRDFLLRKRDSDLGKALFAVRAEVCNGAPLKECPKSWKAVSENKTLQPLLSSVKSWEPPLPGFYSCLQYKTIKATPSPEFIATQADSTARDNNDWLANPNREWMLKFAKKDLIFPDARREPNPHYLNPCGLDKPKFEEFDIEDAQPALFTAAFICADAKLSDAEKIRQAGETAARIQAAVLEKTIPLGGKFSHNQRMISSGFSEEADERFADAIANRVYARMLKLVGPSPSERRKAFLASESSYCDPPSLDLEYPDEAQVQKEFSYEAHAIARQRRYELLSQPIREVLGCKKDFNLKECEL